MHIARKKQLPLWLRVLTTKSSSKVSVFSTTKVRRSVVITLLLLQRNYYFFHMMLKILHKCTGSTLTVRDLCGRRIVQRRKEYPCLFCVSFFIIYNATKWQIHLFCVPQFLYIYKKKKKRSLLLFLLLSLFFVLLKNKTKSQWEKKRYGERKKQEEGKEGQIFFSFSFCWYI